MAISGTDKLEVHTIYKAYFLGLCKGISPQSMALYGTVPPFLDPEIPIDKREISMRKPWEVYGKSMGKP